MFSRVGEQEARDVIRAVDRQTTLAADVTMRRTRSIRPRPHTAKGRNRRRLSTAAASTRSESAGCSRRGRRRTGQLLWRQDFRKDFPQNVARLRRRDVAPRRRRRRHCACGRTGKRCADGARSRPRGAFDGPGRATARLTRHQSSRDCRGFRRSSRNRNGTSCPSSLVDGRLLWQIPFTTDFDQNIVTPVVVDDLLIYSGNQRPLAAVRVVQQGGKWSTSAVWQNEALPNVHEHAGCALAIRCTASPNAIVVSSSPPTCNQARRCGPRGDGRATTPPSSPAATCSSQRRLKASSSSCEQVARRSTSSGGTRLLNPRCGHIPCRRGAAC